MGTPSSRDPGGLPAVADLLRLARSLAVLDAILCAEWEFRYFSFNDRWSATEKLLLMRNGEGDDFLVYFAPAGALIKGFGHASPQAESRPAPDLFAGVPDELAVFLDDPAASRDETTFCLWRRSSDGAWTAAPAPAAAAAEEPDPDGSAALLRFLDGRPATYLGWAAEYFGRPLDAGAVQHVFEYRPLSLSVARALDPRVEYRDLAREVEAIGYPLAPSPFGP